MTVLVAAVVQVAILIQAWAPSIELVKVNRAAVEHWNTEDELTAEAPRRKRRRARRTLRATREPGLPAEIQRVQLTLGSWAALVAASAAAVVHQVWN
jgi:hypothetical protein